MLVGYRMSAQDIWLRKYHELWEKLEDNTKSSFCTALWKWLVQQKLCRLLPSHSATACGCLKTCGCMQAWCDRRGFDTAIHPIPKCVIFLEDLLQEMIDKKSISQAGCMVTSPYIGNGNSL